MLTSAGHLVMFIILICFSTLQSLYGLKVQGHSLFELLSSFRRYRALSTRMKHTTLLLFNYLITTHTYFFLFKFARQTCTHIIVCIVCFVVAILYIAYLCIVLLLSVSCSTVELLSLAQIPRMWNHTWPIKLILILIKKYSCSLFVQVSSQCINSC